MKKITSDMSKPDEDPREYNIYIAYCFAHVNQDYVLITLMLLRIQVDMELLQ